MMRNLASVTSASTALLLCCVLASAVRAQTPPLPTETPADLRQMTFRVVTPKVGYRYAGLTDVQTRALRRDFRLPLEALVAADSPEALAKAADVAPLPNPNEPILAARPAGSAKGNPFTGGALTPFRADPMKALGELLGADFSDSGAVSSASDFGVTEADSLADEPTDTSDAAVGAADDPFGASDDPFAADAGAEEDPFDF